MENQKTAKNRRKARHISAEECVRLNAKIADTAAKREQHEKLNEIEAAMDKRAADIALTVSDMFKFMSISAAMLPNMELEVECMRLKVDDDGVFFEINNPHRSHRDDSGNLPDDFEYDDDYDDEEGLLYDGD